MISHIILIIFITGFVFIPVGLVFYLLVDSKKSITYAWTSSLGLSLIIAFY